MNLTLQYPGWSALYIVYFLQRPRSPVLHLSTGVIQMVQVLHEQALYKPVPRLFRRHLVCRRLPIFLTWFL